MNEQEMDWKSWALNMCDLLDEIEIHRDDPEKVHILCHERFVLAEKHGLTVEFLGPGNIGHA